MSNEIAMCYVKSSWGSDWEQFSGLKAQKVTYNAGPNYSTASLMWEYGCKLGPQGKYIATPYNLANHFVQIRSLIDGVENELFTGIIQIDSNAPAGTINSTLGPAETGNQLFTAYDLSFLLDRAIVAGISAMNGNDMSLQYINHLPSMNQAAKYSAGLIGNRSAMRYSDGAYRYGTDGQVWTHYEYLKMILAECTPYGMNFVLTGQLEELDKVKTVQQFDYMSARDILNKLVQPRFGLGWSILPRDYNGSILIKIFTITSQPITLGSTTLAANDDIRNLVMPKTPHCHDVNLGQSLNSRWDRIIVEGERALACFTLDLSNMQADWTPAEEQLYKDGAKNVAGYSSLGEEEKQKENDAYRSTDNFRHVFTMYSLPETWNWQVDGIPVVRQTDNTGTLRTDWGAGYYNYDKQFEGYLPFSDGAGGYRPPFAVTYLSGKCYYLDRVSESLKDSEDKPYPNVGLSLVKDRLGVYFNARPNHLITANQMSGSEPTAHTALYPTIYTTVSVRTDQRLRVAINQLSGTIIDLPFGMGSFSLGDYLDELTLKYPTGSLRISVPNAELWYALDGTIIDVNADGSLETIDAPVATTGGYLILRNDKALLESIAVAAQAWYGRVRRQLDYTIETLDFDLVPGIMIGTVEFHDDNWAVNTVISRIVYDCVTRKTTISTDFEDVDFNSIINSTQNLSKAITSLQNKVNQITAAAPSVTVRDTVGSGGGGAETGSDLVFVKPLEQAQSDGKMSVKQIQSTLSATNAGTAFDMYMFGDKSSCTLSEVANSYGIDSTSFSLFNSGTGAGTLMVAGKVKNFATGNYEFICVQPVFIKTGPCEVAE